MKAVLMTLAQLSYAQKSFNYFDKLHSSILTGLNKSLMWKDRINVFLSPDSLKPSFEKKVITDNRKRPTNAIYFLLSFCKTFDIHYISCFFFILDLAIKDLTNDHFGLHVVWDGECYQWVRPLFSKCRAAHDIITYHWRQFRTNWICSHCLIDDTGLNCVIEYGLCIKDELLVISEHVCLYIKVLQTSLSNAITFAKQCLMLFEAAELYDHARKTQAVKSE